MSEMSHSEAMKHFVEGMRRAESAARIIAQYEQSPTWVHVSMLLGNVMDKALKRLQTSALTVPRGYAPRPPDS